MKPEICCDILDRMDAFDQASKEICKLNDEKNNLPKKPPALFGKVGCFGVAALCAVPGLVLVVLEARVPNDYGNDWMTVLTLISFLVAGGFLLAGIVLNLVKKRYESGLIRREEIEQIIAEKSALQAHLKMINDAVFQEMKIPERYRTRDAISAFEAYFRIDESMSMADMYARYESETIVREVLKTLRSVNEQVRAIDERVTALEKNGENMVGLLGSILSVSENINDNLGFVRKNIEKNRT